MSGRVQSSPVLGHRIDLTFLDMMFVSRQMGEAVNKIKAHSSYIRDVAWAKDNSLIATASSDKTVKLWYPTTCLQRKVSQHPKKPKSHHHSTCAWLLDTVGCLHCKCPTPLTHNPLKPSHKTHKSPRLVSLTPAHETRNSNPRNFQTRKLT